MINTISKTLGAQEKTQDIKQSPSTKIRTKPYARSRRKRAHRGDRTLDRKLAKSDRTLRSRGSATGVSSSDRTLAANRLNAEQQRSIEYRKVPERRNCDRTCPVACDRTLAASDQLIAALTVRMTGRVRSGRDQRPVSSRKAGFHPQRLLS